MTDVYLGIGTNIGDRIQNIKTALSYISHLFPIEKRSSVYATEPVGYKDQPEFLNLVVKIKTDIDPFELLKELKKIESRMGRELSFRNAPRIIDIDILLFGEELVNSPELRIPHPKLHERCFVLLPLGELIPDYTHPVLHKTIKQLELSLSSEKYVRRIDQQI